MCMCEVMSPVSCSAMDQPSVVCSGCNNLDPEWCCACKRQADGTMVPSIICSSCNNRDSEWCCDCPRTDTSEPAPKRQRVILRPPPPPLQAPVQVNVLRLADVTHIKGICDRIMDGLSWRELARSLVPDKGTLSQVLTYLNDHPSFGDKRRSPNLDYNYDVWKRVYPLFHRAAVINLVTLPMLSTECNLYWVHDGIYYEGLARSLYPFRHCHTLSLQTPCTLEDHGFQTLFGELVSWPQLRHLHLDFGNLPKWTLRLIDELPQIFQLITLDLGSTHLHDTTRDWYQSQSALQRLDYKADVTVRWRRRGQSAHHEPGEWMNISNWSRAAVEAQQAKWDQEIGRVD